GRLPRLAAQPFHLGVEVNLLRHHRVVVLLLAAGEVLQADVGVGGGLLLAAAELNDILVGGVRLQDHLDVAVGGVQRHDADAGVAAELAGLLAAGRRRARGGHRAGRRGPVGVGRDVEIDAAAVVDQADVGVAAGLGHGRGRALAAAALAAAGAG